MSRKTCVLTALVTMVLFLAPIAQAAKLSEDTLAKKNEGWYPTGLPLVNYTTDSGFGYGARAYMYYNGQRGDPYFDSSPYFMQLYAQFYQTTKGLAYHEVNLDMPYFMGTKMRLKTALAYDYNLNENYFGVGEQNANNKLSAPNVSPPPDFVEFDTMKDFDKYVKDNPGYSKWNKYTLKRPTYYFYGFRNITEELKLMLGAEFKSAIIKSWKNRDFEGDDQVLTRLDTERDKLTEAAGGQLGGWVNLARAGIGYDTRDFEPDPHRGYYLDYCFEIADALLGSDFDFYKNSAQAMIFFPLLNTLVLGTRVGYTTGAGDIPFHEQSFFGFALERTKGIGGNRTVLGYKLNRFVAKTMTVANVDLRWQFWEIAGAGQRFGFQLVGFYDAGNVYDEAADPVQDPDWGDYKHGYGGGLVIAWNLSTIVHFYYGMSEEDSNISIDFNHKF